MALNNIQTVGQIIGMTIADQDELSQNITANESIAIDTMQDSSSLVINGKLTINKLSYPTDSFIIDHPVYGILDSPVLKIDGGYTFGNALLFDGTDDFVSCSLNMGSGLRSYSFWAKSNITNYTDSAGIVGDLESTGGMLVRIDSSTNRPELVYNTGSAYSTIQSSTAIDTDWHHYVAIYNNTDFSFYIDGNLIGTLTDTIGATPNASFQLGRDPDQSARYFNGILDEVGIWARELSLTDIEDLHNNGKGLYIQPTTNFPTSGTNVGTNLSVLYHLDESISDITAEDSSGNGIVGFLNNFPTTGMWIEGIVEPVKETIYVELF